MSFNGNEGSFIELNEGSEWTRNYRQSAHYDGINAIFYGKNKLQSILDQEGCMGIRIYKAIDENSAPVMVLVGANSSENDMTGGYLLERGNPCPPTCGGGGGGALSGGGDDQTGGTNV